MVDGGREKGRRGELAHDASSAVSIALFRDSVFVFDVPVGNICC